MLQNSGGERGIRTLEGLLTLTPLAGERFRPLSHLSDMFDSSLSYVLKEGLTRRFAPRPAGALRASVGASRLGSNPRRALNPYSLSRGALWLAAKAAPTVCR